jgi:hypothetical protein
VRSRRTTQFLELYRVLPQEIQATARKVYQIFRENPAHPGLRLERLRSDPRAWAVRITRDYRAIALRNGDDWLWLWIGTHKEFDRKFRV